MRQEEEILRRRVNSEHRTYENRWVGGDQHGEMGTQEGSRGRKKKPTKYMQESYRGTHSLC